MRDPKPYACAIGNEQCEQPSLLSISENSERGGNHIRRVTGVGGIFFKAKDPVALSAWYRDHLGLDITEWGGAIFGWGGADSEKGVTIWNAFQSDTTYLDPGTASFMVNFRVADLQSLLAALREEGCAVEDRTEVSEQGKFGWVIDPEGNKVELWEPPAC